MSTIGPHTKISEVLEHPKGLDVLLSISPKFAKLKRPRLRKLLAKRTTIAMASKVANCSLDAFFSPLKAIGFSIQEEMPAEIAPADSAQSTLDLSDGKHEVALDVRPILDSGKDPLKVILQHINQLEPNQRLKLIAPFEPVPLIQLLKKQGAIGLTQKQSDAVYFTYFELTKHQPSEVKVADTDWNATYFKYKDRLVELDVRGLTPPKPMTTILKALEELPQDQALHVLHERVPVYLIEELHDRPYHMVVNPIGSNDVRLLIHAQ